METRTAVQVVQRAMIMGAVSFRASLEVTDHPRTAEISAQILDWLISLGLEAAIDPLEHELLSTPYGHLEESQRIGGNWSGEGAALFCWGLGLGDQPPLFLNADQQAVIGTLRILRPEARGLLSGPSLRSSQELLECCKTTRLVRLLLREEHIQDGSMTSRTEQMAIAIGRRKLRSEFAETGIEIGEVDFERVCQLLPRFPPEQRRAAVGAYLARDIAVTWLFDSRARYFDNPSIR